MAVWRRVAAAISCATSAPSVHCASTSSATASQNGPSASTTRKAATRPTASDRHSSPPTPHRRTSRGVTTAPTNALTPPTPLTSPMTTGERASRSVQSSRMTTPMMLPKRAVVALEPATARTTGVCRTKASPSRMSREIPRQRCAGGSPSAGTRRVSRARMVPSERAETRNDTASTNNAPGAVKAAMRKPLAPKPPASATAALARSLPYPSAR